MFSPVSINAYQGMGRAFAEAARAAETYVSGFAARETGVASKPGARTDQTVRAAINANKSKTAKKTNAAMLDRGAPLSGALLVILA